MIVRECCFRPGLGRALSGLVGALMVLLSGWWPLLAQDAPAENPIALTSIAEVNRALTDPARTVAVRMRFRGTVIFTSRVGDFCLQDGEAGLMIEPPDPALRPALGDLVEVEAPVAFHAADTLDPGFFFKAATARIIGPGTLPEPVKTRLPDALNGGTAGRWVEVEGVVLQSAIENGVVKVHLTDDYGWAIINVHLWRSGLTMDNWWGARLRVRCANIGRGHPALRATSSDQITLLAPGVAGQFAAPPANFAALPTTGATADRVRVTATVLAREGEYVFLRSDQGPALRASFLGPLRGLEGPILPLELVPPPTPEVFAPGDRLELVGSPLKVAPFVNLSWSSFRKLSGGELPSAVSVEGRNPAELMCDRVRLKGRVRWHELATVEGGVDRLAMDCGGITVRAEIIPPALGAAAPEKGATAFQEGDLIEATGLLLPEDYFGTRMTLRVANRAGLHLVAAPERDRPGLSPVAWRWIIGLTSGLAAALAGAWWLQRIVRERTAALAISNTTLREEVAVREKAQADLARALDQERDLSELKNRFVSMVSHEFRTPLGITMSAVELLRNYMGRLSPEKLTELLDDIHRATLRMSSMMEQMLVLGRLDGGKLAFQARPIDLAELGGKLADESLSATNRQCPIEFHPANDVSGANGDESAIRHIISNLLSNAVKYSRDAKPVEFSVRRDGESAVFTVRDHGIGIPAADQARLFEAFHRATNVGETPGTGLGLLIVKRCVELHRGTIDFDSREGEGTTFHVRLPLFAAAEQKA